MNHDLRITNADFLRRHAGRRGSVLILVVAMLVLMMLIGTAFIQAARFDRAATSELERSGNIERVAQADLQRIIKLISDDLMTSPVNALDGNGSREPYDYAHKDVDPWLAAFSPGSTTGGDIWTNITDVNPAGSTSLWVGNGGTGVNDVRAVPYEPGSTHRINALNYGDADGDGITDSRFAESAIPEIDGIRYVGAYRVIDLSACLNINVASAIADPTKINPAAPDSYSLSITDAPRWRYPTDLDLTRLIAQKSRLTGTEPRTAVEKLMEYRYGLTSPPVLPIAYDGGTDTRKQYWLNGPSMYSAYNGNAALPSTKYRPLGLETELLFRRRNGLNSPDMESPVAGYPGSALRVLMRDNTAASEKTFADVPNVTTTGIPKNYFAVGLTPAEKVNEMRHLLTTVSAASIYAPRSVPGLDNRNYQLDLNKASNTAIAKRIEQVYDQGNPDIVTNLGFIDVAEFSRQLAANIADYRDSDNRITAVGTAADVRYGMERLPAITEAFVQHNYQVRANSATVVGTDRWRVEYERMGGGFAIEIRNPFQRPIDLTYISIEIAGTSQKLTDLGAPATLDANEFLIIHNTDGGTGGPDVIGSHPELVANTTLNIDWGSNPFSGYGEIEVRLIAEADNSDQVDYQLVTVDNTDAPPTPFVDNDYTYSTADPINDKPDGQWSYQHLSTVGNTDGFNMLFVADGDFAKDDLGTTTNFTDPLKPTTYNAGLDNMGSLAKTIAGAPGPVLDPTTNQLILRDDPNEEIWHVGELAHIVVLGPMAGTPIAEQWNNIGASDLSDFMIGFDTTETVQTSGPFQVPHAVALLDQFTTYSPYEDGQDNDGDGKPDASDKERDEIVIPGRLNINTAPDVVLRYAIPMLADIPTDPLTRIRAYRDNPTTRANFRNAAQDMGIASMGELMAIPEVKTAFLANSGFDDLATGVRIDFIPDDTTDDGVSLDREEEALLMRWLNQVCTTRSDVFAVYVNVRGYSATDDLTNSSATLKPVEQLRMVAIVDRSHMVAVGDKPRVLALLRY